MNSSGEAKPSQSVDWHHSSAQQFALVPRYCAREFREFILQRYPALGSGPHALFNRRLLQYILYSQFLDEQTGLQVLPRTVVAACASVSPTKWGFRACEWLDQFGQDVFPLRYSSWSLTAARVINPDWDPEVRIRFLEQCSQLRRGDGSVEAVDLVSGEPDSRRKGQSRRKIYTSMLDELVAQPPDDHPALPLISYLNGSIQNVGRRIVGSNWAAMNHYVETMPLNTNRDIDRRVYVERIMANLRENGVLLRYDTSENSPRIFAIGANINSLPRELRNIALNGTVSLDLRSAQLAIVSKVYQCTQVFGFLNSGGDIWQELIGYLGIEVERKPLLKKAIYAICYGMGRSKYTRLLATGYEDEQDRLVENMDALGLGRELTSEFLRHHLVRELIRTRQLAMRKACASGGMVDAFDRWQVLQNGYPPALLANIAQSYEIRIMMAALPIIQSEGTIHIVSFLHDGMYLHFTDKAEQPRQIARICRAVEGEAKTLGIPTGF